MSEINNETVNLIECSDDSSNEYYDSFEYETEPICLNSYELDIKTLELLNLPDLPSGFGFMGGAARAIYQQQILGEKGHIRDIDIVAISDLNPDSSLDDELSREYMPDDYSHGYGVSHSSIDEYFNSRDFTINEILVVDGKIIVSEEAEYALDDKCIKLTDYELQYENPSYKMVVKSLLLEQVFYEKYGKSSLDENTYSDGYLPNFYIALGLKKAMQTSRNVSNGYINSLVQHGFLPDKMLGASSTRLVDYLKQDPEFSFDFHEDVKFSTPDDIEQDILNDKLNEKMYYYDKYCDLDDEYDQKINR